jgi:hypothetical protein
MPRSPSRSTARTGGPPTPCADPPGPAGPGPGLRRPAVPAPPHPAPGPASPAEFTSYFTEDVVATFEGTDQRADGRQAAGELIRYVHETAFDARPELKNLLVDTGKAAIEADFAGTHTGKFAGIQPHRPRRAGPLLSHLRPGR